MIWAKILELSSVLYLFAGSGASSERSKCVTHTDWLEKRAARTNERTRPGGRFGQPTAAKSKNETLEVRVRVRVSAALSSDDR